MTENITQRELLIRIDERQKQMAEQLAHCQVLLEKKVNLDGEYEEMKMKVDKLWDWKNRVVGYAAGAGAIASIVFEIVQRIAFK